MKVPKIANALNYLDDDLISEAIEYKPKKRAIWFRLSSVAACLCLLAIILPAISNFLSVKAFASIEETSDTVRIFVGDLQRAPANYIDKRREYIEHLMQTDPTQIVQTVVGLDDYYSVEAIDELIKEYEIDVDRIYMWPKGETGRLSIHIENGDIPDGIERYIEQVQEQGLYNDEQATKDFERFLNGEYDVFAITITSSVETLDRLLSENDCIAYADIKYNEEAEAYADKKGKDTYYIELPAKPDNIDRII